MQERQITMEDLGFEISLLVMKAYALGQESMREPNIIPPVEPSTSVDVGGSVSFNSPKMASWNDEADRMLIYAAQNGQGLLEKMSRSDGSGATLSALKSRLYKLGYVQPRGTDTWVEKVA